MKWFSFSVAWRPRKSIDDEAVLGGSWQSPLEVVRREERNDLICNLSDEILVRIMASLDVRDLIR